MLTARDEGSLSLLVIGYTLIAALLVVIGLDVSKVFLAQRALSSAADAAALSGAQSIDRGSVYGGGSCTQLPVDAAQAAAAASASLDDADSALRQTFDLLAAPDVEVAGGTVRVRLHGAVSVPFGGVLALLLPDHPGGRVGVTADAAATTTLTSPIC